MAGLFAAGSSSEVNGVQHSLSKQYGLEKDSVGTPLPREVRPEEVPYDHTVFCPICTVTTVRGQCTTGAVSGVRLAKNPVPCGTRQVVVSNP
eukprot:3463771-Pyramimonas_sp.AAC.3